MHAGKDSLTLISAVLFVSCLKLHATFSGAVGLLLGWVGLGWVGWGFVVGSGVLPFPFAFPSLSPLLHLS